MARLIRCDGKDCETVVPELDEFTTFVVTIGKASTSSLRRELCDVHVAALADLLDAEFVPSGPAAEPSVTV